VGWRENGQWLENTYTPATSTSSATFVDVLTRPSIPDDARYEAHVDRFEYLLGLIIQAAGVTRMHGPCRSHRWLHRYTFNQEGNAFAIEIETEIANAGSDWPPLRAGLFGGDPERLDRAVKAYREAVDRATGNWW